MVYKLHINLIGNEPLILPTAGEGIMGLKTILIVDDDDGICHMLFQFLHNEGYNVKIANDGIKALKILRKGQIDLAIVDISMSGMDGIQLLKRIKSINPGTKVLMLTAYDEIETYHQAMSLGASDFLLKPIDINVLKEAIRKA